MKQRTLIVFMLALVISKNYSQTLKTIKENYNGGEITYQYYEDSKSSEYIKHGTFKYVKKANDNLGGTYSQSITGNFKNGFRDGAWIFLTKNTDYPNQIGTYTTGITSATQTYKDGIPNGLWKVNNSWKTRSKFFFKGSYSWGAFEKPINEYVTTTFINGCATGITTYKNGNETIEKTITLNKGGFLTGNYNFQNSLSIDELSFDLNGVVTKFVSRNKSGKVEYKETFDDELMSTASNYLSGKISKNELKEKYITIDTIGAQNFIDFGDIFEHDYFLLPSIGGDKTYDGTSSQSKRKYGLYILAKRIELINLDSNSDYISAKINGNNTTKISALKQFTEQNSDKLKKADIERLNKEVLKLEEDDSLDKLKLGYENQYQKNVSVIKNYISASRTREKRKEKFSSLTYNSLFKDLKKEDSIGTIILNNLDLYVNRNDFNAMNSTREQADFKKLLEMSEQRLEVVKNQYLPLSNSINNSLEIALNADLISNKVYKTFDKTFKKGNDIFNRTNVYQTQENLVDGLINLGAKKTIFDVYEELIEEITKNIETNKDIDTSLKNIISLSDKVIELKDIDDKERLKNIRKSKTTEGKIKTFLE